MADISASRVMELRSRTGLGMMECKKALAETGGDMAKAEDLLRIRSGAKATKAAGRVAAEGVIGLWVAPDAKTGALVEVNCETDFVARNEDFRAFAAKLAEVVATRHPADVEALLALDAFDGTRIESVRQALVQKIGENISIRRFRRFATTAKLASYVHASRIGVVVEFDGGDETVGKDIAMHVAASGAPGAVRPVAVSKAEVPAELIAKEREIFSAQAAAEVAKSGKPAEIVAKMVEGRIAKYLAEVTLLGQPFVKNPDETVEKVLKAKGATVRSFAMVVVGEGIEKRKDDFAVEVAAMAKA